jgi:hypothetical protein
MAASCPMIAVSTESEIWLDGTAGPYEIELSKRSIRYWEERQEQYGQTKVFMANDRVGDGAIFRL